MGASQGTAKACTAIMETPLPLPSTPLLVPLSVPSPASARGPRLCYFPGVSRQPHTNALYSGWSDSPREDLAWRLALKGRAAPPRLPHSVIASGRGARVRLLHGLVSSVCLHCGMPPMPGHSIISLYKALTHSLSSHSIIRFLHCRHSVLKLSSRSSMSIHLYYVGFRYAAATQNIQTASARCVPGTLTKSVSFVSK